MSGAAQFSCKCGKVTGQISGVTPQNSVQLACSCKHCRAFAAYLGDDDRMFQNGHVQLLQTQPWMIDFQTGKEHLRNLRLTSKGPLRWYAGCCDTPLCNTLAGRIPPFASMMTANFTSQQDLPPVAFHVFCDHLPEDQRLVPHDSGAMRKLMVKFFWRALQGLPFRFKKNPFFDEKGAVLSAPVPVDAQRKSAAYDT